MADEQANEQARKLANEYIKNKTKDLYIYINNNAPENEFDDLTKEDWSNIRSVLKNIDLLVCDEVKNMIQLTGHQEEFEAYYWGVKELYKSPHRAYLNTIKREKITLLYANSKKKLETQKKEYMTLDLLNYFIKSLKLEAEKEFNNAR